MEIIEGYTYYSNGCSAITWDTISGNTIKFSKTHEDAVIPCRAHQNDAGYDVRSVEEVVIPAMGTATVNVGLKFEYIPKGYWIRVAGRSGLGFKNRIIPFAGVIDAGYQGPLGILLQNYSNEDYTVVKGKAICQLIIHANITIPMEFSKHTEKSDRGENGFGSTG